MSKKIKRTYPHKDVTLCLDAGLAAERDALMKQRGPQAKKHLAELEARMRDSLITIRVCGVSRAEYRKIQQAHPSKTATQAFDPDTFFLDFIYKTGYEVDGDEVTKLSTWDRADWDEIADGLTEGEWSDLAVAVHETNATKVETGFLSRGSVSTEPSVPNSEPPATGE